MPKQGLGLEDPASLPFFWDPARGQLRDLVDVPGLWLGAALESQLLRLKGPKPPPLKTQLSARRSPRMSRVQGLGQAVLRDVLFLRGVASRVRFSFLSSLLCALARLVPGLGTFLALLV